MKRKRIALSVLVLAIVLRPRGAHGRCEGDSCPEESRDARASGLLGGTAVQQCSRTKDYPLDGSKLKPVRSCEKPADLHCQSALNYHAKTSQDLPCAPIGVPMSGCEQILKISHLLMQVEFEAPVVDLRWAGLNHDYDRVSFTEATEKRSQHQLCPGILLYTLSFCVSKAG